VTETFAQTGGKHLGIIIDYAKFRQNRFTCRVKAVWCTDWGLQVVAIEDVLIANVTGESMVINDGKLAV